MVYASDIEYAPQVRPPVFPLMLAPFYLLAGLQPVVYHLLLTLLLFISFFLAWKFLFRDIESVAAIFFLLVIAYNPYTLKLKAELPIEFPMMCLIYLGFYLLQKRKYLFGFLFLVLACLTKYTAIAALLASVIYVIFNDWKYICKHKSLFLKIGALVVAGLIVFFFFIGDAQWYYRLFIAGDISGRAAKNLIVYQREFYNAFEQEVPSVVNSIIKLIVIILFVTGFIIAIAKKKLLPLLFFLLYFIVLLIYDYSKGGYRFLFPLMPIIAWFIYLAVEYFSKISKIKLWICSACYCAFMLVGYSKNIIGIIRQTSVITGPQQAEFIEAIDFIKGNITQEKTVYFKKPFLISLYAQRPSKLISTYETHKDSINGVSFLLLAKQTEPELYVKAYEKYFNGSTLLFENSKFSIVSLNP